MVIDILKDLFKRDLQKLKLEWTLYSNEDNIWKTDGDISNCGGNLCLHLVGNLKIFIGGVLNNSGYIRKRELEFSAKNIPRDVMITMVDETIEDVLNTLNKLSEQDLLKEYPVMVFKNPQSTGYFLIHLSTHLGYHLGQINYHRRLLDHDRINWFSRQYVTLLYFRNYTANLRKW